MSYNGANKKPKKKSITYIDQLNMRTYQETKHKQLKK